MKNFTKNNNIEFDLSLIDDNLITSISYPFQSMGQLERKKIPLKMIKSICFELIETLNSYTRTKTSKTNAYDHLIYNGKKITKIILNNKSIKKIINSSTRYMIIKLDEELTSIPWELMYIEDFFLCERFHIGRKIKTSREIPDKKEKQLNKPLKMLIVANPESNLASASKEGIELCNLSDEISQNNVHAKLDSGDVKLAELYDQIRFYDIFHFAGHAEYHKNDPKKCGLKLKDNLLSAFTIEEQASISPNIMPVLVFSNACQTARTLEQDNDKIVKHPFDLANAFIFSGVNHYIGTFWEVLDEPSSEFALEFYHNFFKGKTIGESVSFAREKLKQKYGHNSIGWASYLTYGDPSISYFDNHEPISKICTNSFEKNHDNNEKDINIKKKIDIPRGINVLKNMHFNTLTLIIICIFFLCICILIICNYDILIRNYDKPKITDKILQTIINYEKQENIKLNELYNELYNNTIAKDQYIDRWTSKPLTIILDVPSLLSKLNQNKEKQILNVINREILFNTDFQPLEREYLYQILKEKHFFKKNNMAMGNIKQGFFHLYLFVEKGFIFSTIIIRLVDDQTKVLYTDIKNNIFFNNVSKQIPGLIKGLIDKMIQIRKNLRIRGKIIDINFKNNEVLINIGKDNGVQLNQKFFIAEDPKLLLEVKEVGQNDSTLKLLFPNTDIQKYSRVEISK